MLKRLREYVRPFYLRNIYFPLFPRRKPPYFDACWEFPPVRPEPDGGPVVVFLPMNDWHSRMQRTQHLTLALAKRGYRCVYLNPHLGREFPGRFRPDHAAQVTQLHPGLFELHVHLPREPVFHHRLLSAEETSLLAHAARGLLHQLGPSRIVQIVSLPVWMKLAQILRQSHSAPIVYDCHDYLPGFRGIAPAILQVEPELFRTSDLVICSANALRERAQSFGVPESHCVLIRNAAAAEFLTTNCAEPKPAHPIRVGYVGALDSWFDVESLHAAAAAHPEWQFHLAGRVENPAVGKLSSFPNVHLAGEISFSRLPELLCSFTVAIIPFLLNPLIRATDPIKVYEYLAAGLPIVSSELPELERFGDLIARYRDPPDFVRKIELAARQNDAITVEQRREAARRATWEQRAAELAGHIEALLGQRM